MVVEFFCLKSLIAWSFGTAGAEGFELFKTEAPGCRVVAAGVVAVGADGVGEGFVVLKTELPGWRAGDAEGAGAEGVGRENTEPPAGRDGAGDGDGREKTEPPEGREEENELELDLVAALELLVRSARAHSRVVRRCFIRREYTTFINGVKCFL